MDVGLLSMNVLLVVLTGCLVTVLVGLMVFAVSIGAKELYRIWKDW